MRFVLVLAFILCLLGMSSRPASSSAKDWIVSITTKEVKKCLDYHDSKLQPLIRARVNFEQGYEEGDDDEKALAKEGYIDASEIPDTVYEDIFYSNAMPLGLKRYKDLGIRPGTPGTIKIHISETGARQDEANAAANATVRIFLDAYRKKSALKTIIVPKDNFDLFLQGMQRYNFRQLKISADQPVMALVVMSVRSDPAGRVTYLGYGM